MFYLHFGKVMNRDDCMHHSVLLEIVPAWLAQLVVCLALHLGVSRFDSRVQHILLSATGEGMSNEYWLTA